MNHSVFTLAPAMGLVAMASCGANETPAPAAMTFATRSIVAPALERLDKAIGEPTPIPAPTEELRDLADNLIVFLNTAGPGMSDAAFDDAKAQGDSLLPVFAGILSGTSNTDDEKRAAARLLAGVGTPAAAQYLLGQLESNRDEGIRAICAWKIGDMGFDFVIPSLVKRLKYEKARSVTPWLALSLSKLDNFAGVAYLITVANLDGTDSDAAAQLQGIAIEAGFSDGYALNSVWLAGDLDNKLPQSPRSQRYEREVWRLIDHLQDFQLRGVDDSRFVLSSLGKSAVPILGQALHDESSYVRSHVAQVLLRMGGRGQGAGGDLIAGLNDNILAPYAAEALGAIKFPSAESALLRSTGVGFDPGLRLAAVRGLKQLGLDSSAPALRELLAEPDFPELAQAAAEALVTCGYGDEVAGKLLSIASGAADSGLDPDTSLWALRWWVADRSLGGDELAAQVKNAYDALAPIPGIPPTTQEDRQRRQERLALFSKALQNLLESDG
jgi:HEAT repeat protein